MTKIRGFALSLIAVAGLAAPDSALAVRTDFWEVVGREEMAGGTPTEITIGPLGSLQLAPEVVEVEGLSEYYAWSMASGKGGDLYVGTGDGGKVYRIDRSGKAELIFDSIELDILSLAVDKDGNVFAGTSPDGIVLKIDAEGNGESFFDTPERYVWSLVFDDRGRLYVGTGEQGKVYRVEPSGKAELFYDSPETNVLSLLYDPKEERLLFGGDGKGLVMEIDVDGNPRVLFETPRGEVGALLLDEEGNLFAAASGNGGQGENGAKKKALLYRIHPEGSVVLLWESEAEFIYALARWERDLLAGTGSPGSLVRITPEGEATEIKRTTESQVLALERMDGRVYAGTGNQGNVYRLGPAPATEGTYESKTHDGMNTAFWGNLRWWGEEAKGTSVTFSTRSGNTETPDETWSEWEEIGGSGKLGAVRSPAARYLQWKAVLGGDGKASPRVDRVVVAYKEQNLPPRVLELEVTRAGDPFYEGPADPRPEPLFQVLPNGTRVEYMPLESHGAPPTPADEAWARSVRVIRWQASDANGDELLYDIYCRAEGEEEWKLLDDEIQLSFHSWDTRSVPDGLYRVRVVARDEGENSEATALEGERTSDPFLVDNTVPVVARLDVSREGDRLRVRAKARDEASPLRTAQYSLNSKEWKIVDPVDRIFDGLEEEFDFTVPSAEGKEQVLGFRVIDQAGNATVGRATLR